MVEGDRPEDEAPPPTPKRRRRPPTLELKATEVGGPSAAAEAPQAERSEAPKQPNTMHPIRSTGARS